MTFDPLVLAAVLAFLIGIVMGLFGGGGSVLSVPMLLYVARLEGHAAIAVSLVMVSASSALGALVHARSGALRLRPALVFAVLAAIFAFVGGVVARFFPAWVLLVVFAFLMVLSSARMLWNETPSTRPASRIAPVGLGLIGAVTGFVSGLIGAGGGFMVVPSLVFFVGLTMHEAVATSLFVIAFSSFSGFVGHSLDVSLDARLIAMVTLPSLAGVVLGARFAQRVPSQALRKGFGLLVLALGLFLLLEQLKTAFS